MAEGVEFSDLNWLGIGLAMVSNIIIGFLWYAQATPTGKIWMRGAGLPAGHKPASKQMAVAMVLMVVGTFFLMFVLQHTFVAYEDSYKLDRSGYNLTYVDGLMGAFFTWLGFFVPVQLSAVGWEGKPWSLFLVNAGYYLVSLLAASVILVWSLT